MRSLRRADQLNVVEARLGHTFDEDGVRYILIDRVVGFAVDDVWPLLASTEQAADGDPLAAAEEGEVQSEWARPAPTPTLYNRPACAVTILRSRSRAPPLTVYAPKAMTVHLPSPPISPVNSR